jgi:hypothetical protein
MTDPAGTSPDEDQELSELFSRIADRFRELRNGGSRQSLLAHIRSLTRWEQEPNDYGDVQIAFPERIAIAVAVCHPECGRAELIVDGSTQECQRCGGLMFRTEITEYRRA